VASAMKNALTAEVVDQLDYICLWRPSLISENDRGLVNRSVEALKKLGPDAFFMETEAERIAEIFRKTKIEMAMRDTMSNLEPLP
jgi:hypothetical protein